MVEFPINPSEAVKKLNPHIWRGVGNNIRPIQAQIAKPTAAPSLDNRSQKHKGRKSRVAYRVSLVVLSRRAMDSDNLQGSCKGLRDAIAESIGIDDGSERITWEYGWAKTSGQQGVLVKITAMTL